MYFLTGSHFLFLYTYFLAVSEQLGVAAKGWLGLLFSD
jgi:hypothetical protein